MATRTWWESFETHGGRVVDKVKELIKEGNVRRIRIRQRERVVAEFPLTIGVVGAVFAPVLAAIGAITALVTDCTLEVEREERDDERGTRPEEQPQEAERV